MRRDFREVDPRSAKVLLVEAVDRVLAGFAPSLSGKAALLLEGLGVTPLLKPDGGRGDRQEGRASTSSSLAASESGSRRAP